MVTPGMSQLSLVSICAMVVLVVVVLGVALPAVWSRKESRRRAAAAVLRLLLPRRSAAQDRPPLCPEAKPGKDQHNT